MNKSLLAVAVASLLPYASFSFAQDTSADETVVVTANRFETQVSDTLAPVEVITRQEIDAIQAQSLSDVLRRLPGVQVANQGGPAQGTELYLRGRATKNTLVLVNGVRIGSATTGAANLSAIPLNGVERIEVLRGPRAAVYGSDAVSGVINIITTKGKNGRSSVKAGVGSFGAYDLSGSLSLSSESGQWVNLSATHQAADGYNVQPSSTNSLDGDRDGYKSQYLIVDAGTEVSPALTLKANGYYQKHNVEYDNSYVGVDNTDSDLYSLAVIGEYQQDQWNSHVTLSTNQDDAKSYGQGTDASSISTNRYLVSWDNQYVVNPALSFVGGMEWYRDKVDNDATAYTKTDRDNSALYVGSYLHKGDFSAESNFRWDDNSAYGNFWTYQFGLGYQVSQAVKLVGLYGTSFKAPTFNNLYWPLECSSWGCYQGNPDLEPEETESGEIAIESHFELFDLRVAAHRSDVDKMIVSDSSYTSLANIDKAVIKGYEVAGSFDTGPLNHQVSYDYLDTENKTTGKQLVRRAKHSAKWNVTYALEFWQFDVSYLYQGKRFDDTTNSTVLDPYSLVDVSASYHFGNGVTLSGKVGNVFDKEYETAKDYKTPERNYYASIAYQF
ncbi:TonB-dependent receptor [Vibrio fluvialis]|uniref:TonB-dependent receptor domain-containing protein n=1 Tax=Vibrio fluvialis TaxID=676 RepID=UPI001BAE88EF|nr:TonB-dependent receptor [Vibrio fluvialis]EKO3501536.1 TonB-dependent receptor [Vibrio fluvialis]EKO3971456.1 TonB-dependent receptor [Vibrio fluvialis]EKZ9002528.1 TonB-dependent receptor [Vibrio fluvialis]ELI1831186.1 TonB-dependent receptor [Vibrio fluvialis]MBY7950085.1 TonB-dependent receptor [Vibrio fluvialis]